jgi:L-lactate dehydrogenase (cytochrome)/(S)-mandelate dehydrogenase
MLDSGVRRGSDVVIARILGARFCFLGRPTLYAVTAGGQRGADLALSIIRHEIDVVLAQLGCPSIDALDASYLHGGAHPEATLP